MSVTKKIRESQNKQTAGRRFRPRAVAGIGADWRSVDIEVLREVLAVVATKGGALRLGYTRDGGAFSVGVYGDGPEPYTEYIRPGEDVAEFFHELEQVFDNLPEAPGLPF